MKKFFKLLSDLLDSWAQARAAAVLARLGKIDEAKKIYQ